MQSGFEPLPRTPELRVSRVGHRDVKLPLLLDEAVEALMHSGGSGAVYVDGSLGHGGHSAEILRRLDHRGRLLAFDVASHVGTRMAEDERMEFFPGKCQEMRDVLRAKGLVPAGVLLDLGVQMTAAEEKERGLSYYEAAPLDGRLDRSKGIPASLWLQQVSAAELASVLQDGEGWTSPLLAHRLAEAILHRQAKLGPYRSTLELAEVICSVKGSDDRGFHPAKQAFQAMRRFLNQEIGELEEAMESALSSLENGGRLIVITTCRKEASAVKRFLRHHEAPDLRFAEFVTPQRMVELFPLAGTTLGYSCRQLCDPIRASAAELARNPRAKVALLHVLQKEERSLQSCEDRGLIGLVPRPLTSQFRTPAALPLHAPDDLARNG